MKRRTKTRGRSGVLLVRGEEWTADLERASPGLKGRYYGFTKSELDKRKELPPGWIIKDRAAA